MASRISGSFGELLSEMDAGTLAGPAAKLPDSQVHDEGTLVVTPGGSVSGVVDFADDIDTISMTLAAGTYVISLAGTGATPLLDPYLESAGLGLVDDDGGNGVNSLITFTVTSAGTYTFQVGGYPESGVTGGYTVHLAQRAATDTVPGTIASTVAANIDAPTFGFIDASNDVDVYRVTLTEGLYYNFAVAGGTDYSSDYPPPLGEVDTVLTVYDAGGNVVFTNDDVADDYSSAGSFLAEDGGVYYVEVASFPGQTGGYRLDIESIDLAEADPLDAIDWGGRDNVAEDGPLNDGVFYVYFAGAGQTFDGVTSLGWTAYERQQAMAAWNTYSTFADVTFAVTNNQSRATFTLVTTESDEFLGSFNPPGTTNAGVGLFAINGFGWDRNGSSGGLEQGGYAFATLIHEFGHGLGMAHPHDDGGGSEVMPGVTDAFDSYGVYDLNQAINTVMSYNDGWPLHPDAPADGTPEAWGNVAAGMAFDIALMQEKYGAVACAPANTVYVLTAADAAGAFYECIWDTGGTDTIRYNGTADAVIDLTAATLDYSPTGGGIISWVDGVLGGFTIANGVTIEYATGGSGNDTLGGNAVANRLIGNAGDDRLVGRGGDDRMTGGDGVDNLSGGAGNDVLNGGAGADTMAGGAGDDNYSVDDAGDVVTEAAGAGLDKVTASTDYVLAANVENLTLASAARVGTGNALANTIFGSGGADTLSGLAADDILRGREGRDTLLGGNGLDLLDGGAGKDTLTGGSGRDTFQFRDGDFGATRTLADVITDFSKADGERISLNLVDANSVAGGNQAFAWIGNGAFTGVAGQLHYAQAGGSTYVEGDTNGDGTADFVIALTGTINLAAADFVL